MLTWSAVKAARSSPTRSPVSRWSASLRAATEPAGDGNMSSTGNRVEDGSTAVAFTVTVVNKTDDDWMSSAFRATVQSGGEAASQVVDAGNDILYPADTVPPGESAEFVLLFSVADPEDIAMTVTPAVFGESATLTY